MENMIDILESTKIPGIDDDEVAGDHGVGSGNIANKGTANTGYTATHPLETSSGTDRSETNPFLSGTAGSAMTDSIGGFSGPLLGDRNSSLQSTITNRSGNGGAGYSNSNASSASY